MFSFESFNGGAKGEPLQVECQFLSDCARNHPAASTKPVKTIWIIFIRDITLSANLIISEIQEMFWVSVMYKHLPFLIETDNKLQYWTYTERNMVSRIIVLASKYATFRVLPTRCSRSNIETEKYTRVEFLLT